ncbi:MAG TPA: tetratricopeptide repeat-containing glycosyltransferase family protein [Pirellulales bacterium]|nr:tetratricopeptide repeat-containing glycosyltransferase family protein [Pirellulales bacterium]
MNPDPRAGTSADMYGRWGAQLLSGGQTADAVLAFKEAVRLRPDSAEAHNCLGAALRLQGRIDEGIFHCREAVRLAPGMAEAHNNLGCLLERQGRIDEAIVSLTTALRLKPDFANAYSNLGMALYRQRRYSEAAANYRQAISLEPDLADAHNNLGSVLVDLGQSEEALASFSRAIQLRPDYREPHWGRALVWLSAGDFERGWREFEWRLSPAETRRCRQPRWDGSDLAGRTIVLDAEQGLGDTLQFVRYGAALRERGGKVVLVCQPRLVDLLATCCPTIDHAVAQGATLPPFDVHLPLLSLPFVLGTTLATVPATVPYLQPDRRLVEAWRGELARRPGFKIGIAWQGSPDYPGDRERSIPLAEFEPLALVPGVQLVSLQKGRGSEQVPQARFPILDFGERLDEDGPSGAGPFMDTAALMCSLDLVVTCDSALGHLAGALGVRVWTAVAAAPDWRWVAGRDDSAWYPTLRLFRQSSPGEWAAVFQRIASELRQLPAGV